MTIGKFVMKMGTKAVKTKAVMKMGTKAVKTKAVMKMGTSAAIRDISRKGDNRRKKHHWTKLALGK